MATNADNLSTVKYILIGLDIATTGLQLADEIVQIAAYTPTSHFAQNILPYRNVNPDAKRLFQVRVSTRGYARKLECTQCSGLIKSMPEYSALKQLLGWIEIVLSADPKSKGVIFVYHEESKFTPHMLLNAMKRYDLLERFLRSAKAFANGYKYAEEQCSNVNNFSLSNLAEHLFNNTTLSAGCGTGGNSGRKLNMCDGSARHRAKLAFHIAMHLSKRVTRTNIARDVYDQIVSCTERDLTTMSKALHKYAHPISFDIDGLDMAISNEKRQFSFRPVFWKYYQIAPYHRDRAFEFQTILAANGHDVNSLQHIWAEKGKVGLTESVSAISELDPEQTTELVDLFESFYDPTRMTLRPILKRQSRSTCSSRRPDPEPESGPDP